MLCILCVCGSAKAKLQASYDDANDVAVRNIDSSTKQIDSYIEKSSVLGVAVCSDKNEFFVNGCLYYY
ncbi:MAG: hypothetical protein KAS69_01900 [Planctomycetes bacterium]|nr:hypothetical protein [Planctomycetota bacterium]